jgi:hypothetical protein
VSAVPGRKPPRATESERDRAYRVYEKRSYGDAVAGDEAKDLDELEVEGPVGDVARERAAWRARKEGGER